MLDAMLWLFQFMLADLAQVVGGIFALVLVLEFLLEFWEWLK